MTNNHQPNARDYQRELNGQLSQIFINLEIEESMRLPGDIYTPRIDLAIGRFAYEENFSNEYNQMLENNRYRPFIDGLVGIAINQTLIDFQSNPNPRCFMAIEVENSTQSDAKHILGSMTNASILGKIGIVVLFSNRSLLERITNYFEFAQDRRKINITPWRNVALVIKNEFDLMIQNMINEVVE